jgi:hypothetical protein
MDLVLALVVLTAKPTDLAGLAHLMLIAAFLMVVKTSCRLGATLPLESVLIDLPVPEMLVNLLPLTALFLTVETTVKRTVVAELALAMLIAVTWMVERPQTNKFATSLPVSAALAQLTLIALVPPVLTAKRLVYALIAPLPLPLSVVPPMVVHLL